MKRYLIKKIIKTTAEHPLGEGLEAISYEGKDSTFAAFLGAYYEAENRSFDYRDSALTEAYGYKRKCDAKRSWTWNNPNTFESESPFWEFVSIEIEEVDIA